MFNKKKCVNCRKKVGNGFDFCPFCGKPVRENSPENWGLLGKNDAINMEDSFNLPSGVNKMIQTLIKNLGSQLVRDISSEKNQNAWKKNNGIRISISTSGNVPPKMKTNSFRNSQNLANIEERKELPLSNIISRNLKSFSGLPKVEPQTKLRRLSNKIIYEVDLPGVKVPEDISIIKLENGIEVRAVSKDKAYEKRICIDLPILKKNFSKEKLVLELDAKN